jgi:tetratricopeptide (TPR) repeat protein
MESLRLIWSKSSQHIPTLELIFRICDESGDEYALPEVLEALGHAYAQRMQFEEAERAFQRLVSREPANERYKVLLRQVLQKQGKDSGKAHIAHLPPSATALTQEEGVATPVASALRAAEREAMVKEALENSELFARYDLVRKAIAELDRVLEIYPDETEIHRRLLGMCWKDMPERAEQAAQALAGIYAQRGDAEAAKRFAQMAGGREAPAAQAVPLHAVRAPVVSPEPLRPLPAQPAATAEREIGLASEFSLTPVQGAETAPTPQVSSTASRGVTVELSHPPEQDAPAATPTQIPFDLSAAPRVESPSATTLGRSLDPSIPPARKAPPPPPPELPIDLTPQASSVPSPPELPIDLVPQASSVPPPLPELPIDLPTRPPSAPPPAPPSEIQEIDLSQDWESFQVQTATPSPTPETPQEAAAFNYDDSRIEVDFYLGNGFVEEARKAVEDLERTLPGDPRIAELRALVEAHTGALAAEVPEKQPAETLKPAHLKAVAPPAEEAVERWELAGSYAAPDKSTAPNPAPASPLSELPEEIGEAPGTGPVQEDDPETHYNLGVAFREMNLLDEAIGEFQRVVKGAEKRHHPRNYLQACTLLATCFMDKGMAPVAVKWYCRALETPDLDEEAWLALQYDLGVAYEQAGDLPRALEKFSEVYGQNIDFRDVAEKIRTFQQKGS